MDSLPTTLQTGIGDGEGQTVRQGQNKICVANKLGELAINFGTTDRPEVQKIPVYQQLSTMAPASSPRVLDVFIDHKLYRSVRY